jgi:hypothetical protein
MHQLTFKRQLFVCHRINPSVNRKTKRPSIYYPFRLIRSIRGSSTAEYRVICLSPFKMLDARWDLKCLLYGLFHPIVHDTDQLDQNVLKRIL